MMEKKEKKLTDIRAFLLRKEPEQPPAPTPVWGVEDLDRKRARALEVLGERWLLHPIHAPLKGDYAGWPVTKGAVR
jgi:hypothetical protein